MLTAVIIDDEIDAVYSIELIINEYCSTVSVVGKANSAFSGRELILEKKPDIVFLDIEMPRSTGFDLLEMLPERNFEIIFITAYNNWAIKAFKYSAIDYILKPVDIDELIDAVNKAEKRLGKTDNSHEKYQVLLNNIKINSNKKISIATTEGIEYVEINKIIRFEGEGSYSKVFLVNKNMLLVSKNLKEFEELLSHYNFFRTHNSHLINLDYVKKYILKDGGHIEMKDDSIVSISRRKKDLFSEMMQKYIS